MRIVITGGGGFIGRKLAQRLLKEGALTDSTGARREIAEIVLFDQIAPPAEETADPRISAVTGDLTDQDTLNGVICPGTDTIFHLASIVSAGAEADFELGYRVNLDGTRMVLEAARALANVPKVLFASSIAVYGGEIPECVTDETILTPETSYGAHKASGEFLITDYSRKGFIDGRAMRLPTIVVRPGKPNAAASGFASGIVREPLNGIDFVCPVSPASKMAIMSPRTVIDCFVHMHELDSALLGPSKALLLTGFSVAMSDVAAAVAKHAGNRKVGAISFETDDHIQAIVDAWPKASYSERAAKLGFPKDDDIEAVIRAHIEDELD